MSARLRVTIDGSPLPEEEARAFWHRFSAHLEAQKGDLEGFARSEGLASVHPEVDSMGALLVASRTAPQRAYTRAPERSGGSAMPQSREPASPARRKNAGSGRRKGR
jgi:hypothetical protein